MFVCEEETLMEYAKIVPNVFDCTKQLGKIILRICVQTVDLNIFSLLI